MSTIFTGVTFYFVFKQKLSKFDFIGGLFATFSVVLIGVGGGLAGGDEEPSDITQTETGLVEEGPGKSFYLLCSIGVAILAAMLISYDTVIIEELIIL